MGPGNLHWRRTCLVQLQLAAEGIGRSGAPLPRRRPRSKKAVVPFGTYFKAVFRYVLIALAVYVIFKVLNVPVLSMIFGLCALGAATFAVSVHEILNSPD